MAAKEGTPPADAASPDNKTSAKRKSAVDEIEVDLAAPEPPSKRARRALKKGKALPAKPSSDDEKDGGDGDDKKDKKDKVRSEHAVWIGNLPFSATPELLRKWLVDNSGGVITSESITRIKLPTTKEPGRDKSQKPANKGFAYVDFAELGPKVAAVALSENDMGGRKLLIKDATSFEGRPAKEKEAADGADETGGNAQTKEQSRSEANASRKVFVGNMSFGTTEDDLRKNFEKCGEIEWLKLATFEDSGKCKGFGWVKFKEPEAAAWAVKGFVKIKEEIETEDDFKEDGEEDDDGDGEKQKQFKTRKWWVNRLLGRQLKLELAEDDQTRYKKRFTKGGGGGGGARGPRDRPERREQQGERRRGDGGEPAEQTAQELQEARLMGKVVPHTGTKMTFD
ncbi:Nucleolar protein 13 [Purpureocillium takamizusanense]|uniref:Nucleolar protein 13 n=1 Tax=Purpureocillium takamizusanense TaxID=2060973 RepID=A0A9Q8VBI4_9HYPO|nr:Nucleolar protein 13 [Purpureocillium takamizusanense]UNI20555.1 Nucleolar protein 13 [Purpureocillium takamizusanense]